MRKNKKLILISSILATTAIAVVPALSIVNTTNIVNVSDSQLDNVVQNSQQVESTNTLIINSNECDVGSSKATEWMGITANTGLVNFEIDLTGLTAVVKNVTSFNIASSNLKIPGSITYNTKAYIVTSIELNVFRDCTKLSGSLTIPASVTSIGSQAFSGCSGLKGNLTIPASVTTIADMAFAYCSGLLSVTIPASVTTIGRGAFQNCSALTGTLTIPASVTTISDFAFMSCPSITDITVLATTPPIIAANSFGIFTPRLHVPAGSEELYKKDAIWGKFNIEPIPAPPGPDPVKPTDNLNLPLIIGSTVGGATVLLAAIAGVVTYVAKRNKKDKKDKKIKSN